MILIITVLCCAQNGTAQPLSKKHLYLATQVGVLIGERTTGNQLFVSGNMQHKYWSFGIGAGMDRYEVTTIPVAAMISRSLPGTATPFFTYGMLGYNIAAPAAREHINPGTYWTNPQSSFTNGWYGEWGIGYALLNKKKQGIECSIGYSIKTTAENYSERLVLDPGYLGNMTIDHHLVYRFSRLLLKFGFRI